MDRIEVGEKITCPDCGDEIALVTKTIFSGMQLMTEMFHGIQKPLVHGDIMACKCGGLYFSGGKLHTENGWKP